MTFLSLQKLYDKKTAPNKQLLKVQKSFVVMADDDKKRGHKIVIFVKKLLQRKLARRHNLHAYFVSYFSFLIASVNMAYSTESLSNIG